MAAGDLLFRVFEPCDALRPYVEGYTLVQSLDARKDAHFEVACPPRHELIPRDHPLMETLIPCWTMSIGFNLGDPFRLEDGSREILSGASHVNGPITRRMTSRLGARVEALGVMFRAGRSAPFLPPPAELANRFTPLGDIWGGGSRALEAELRELASAREQVRRIEQELLVRLRHGSLQRGAAVDLRFASITDLIQQRGGLVSVAALSDLSGLSRQHLTRRFRQMVGFGPKQFCRIARFSTLLNSVMLQPKLDWATAAVDHGYYDQAHLIAEFKEFTGQSPTRFFAAR